MAIKLRPSSILCSLLFFSLVIGTSLAARNLNDHNNNVLEWVKRDHRRFLRAVIYVSDLHRSITDVSIVLVKDSTFYTQGLGMKVLKTRNFPDRQYKDALVGFGPQNTHFLLELRQRLDSNNVLIGTEFGHFGIATQDIYKSMEKARGNGAVVIEEPRKTNQSTLFGFVQDRDGYRFKLIQISSPLADPFCEVMLHVQDVNLALNFYTKALGMKLFKRQSNSTGQIVLGTLGYGTNQSKTTVLQFENRKNIPRNDGSDGYSMLYIGTNDVNKSAEAAKVVMKELGGNIIIEPGLLSNINVKITAFIDPENWITLMVDNKDYQRGTL